MALFASAAVKPYSEITSPLFDEITIHLNNDYYQGKEFVIKTENNQPDNIYIQTAKLNGRNWENCWFYHSVFEKGVTSEIELGEEPNK